MAAKSTPAHTRSHPRSHPRAKWIGRASATTVALATGLALTVTPAMAADAQHAHVSWTGVWNWLTRGNPTLRLPAQQSGTARGLRHYVPASATRGHRGRGYPRGRGHGQLPPFKLHGPAKRTTRTGRFIGNGAHSFNPLTSKPIMSKATATTTLYRNADGSHTRLIYPGPINYLTPNGAWHPINIRLVRASGGRLRETANATSVSLANKASDPNLVSVGFSPSERAAIGLFGAAPVSANSTANTVSYSSALPQTDLSLSTVFSGLTESLVLHSPAAPSSWTFPLKLVGLTPKLARDGAIDIVTATGQVMAQIPPAHMQDSKFNKRSGLPASSTAITYQLVTVHGQPTILMTASKAWLDNPARVYPVTVDLDLVTTGTTNVASAGTSNVVAATTNNFNTSGTTKVLSDAGSTDYSAWDDLDVGTWNNGGEIGRSFIAFSGLGSSLAGQHISAATLHIWDYWASSCTTPEPFYVAPITQSWSVSGAKTYPGPSMGSSIGSATYTPSNAQCITNTSGDTNVGGDMPVTLSTSTFNSWTTGGADNGLGIYAGATTNFTWKRFDSYHTSHPPYLALTYTPDVAPQINSQYPPDNFNSPSLTPELLASGSDPDNWPSPIKYVFTVYTPTGTQVATSGLISTGDWVVPAGKLSWAQTYYWTVQDYDGFDYSSAVNAKYFTTQVPQPLITSTLAQNSDGHGFDQSVGNYTTSETDANVQTAGPSLSVVRDYNSLDPRTSGAFGAGWSSLYDMKATEVADASGNITSVVITYPDGSEVGFGDNNGTFASPSGRYSTLTALPSHGGYTLTDKGDTTYTFAQAGSASNVFDISSIADYQGDKETFTYTSGQLSTVTNGVSGRALHFHWSTPSGAQSSHVDSVSTDPATVGNSSTALTWTYGYTGDQLTSVCPPASPTQCSGYSYTTGSHFPTAVLDTGPAAYWRLNEGSGGTAVDSVLPNEGVYNGTYSNVTLGQPGSLPGSTATSASFNGTSSYMQLPASLASNASYLAGGYLSVSLWFKTTTDNGVLFSYQSNPISAGTTTGSYVPALYVGSDGKLNGELWGSVNPTVSSSSVADGNWHYVVLTAAGNTQSLYLDGALVGNQTGLVGLAGQSYAYVGAGFIGGSWPDESHHLQSGSTGYATYFNGNVSDVALYSHYLTAQTVSAIYATGHASVGRLSKVTTPLGNTKAQIAYNSVTDRVTSVTDNKGGTWTLGAPTVAGSSAVYRSAVLGANPAGYWRLGDTGTPTQATDEVLGGPGNYNSVTLGATGPFSDGTAATFNGTSSYVQMPSSDNPGTGPASVGLWFKMNSGSTAGGVLYDYEGKALNDPTQPSGSWVPGLYVGTDGKLRGLFWNGGTSTITSSGTVNDGKWHYAVLAASPTGQSLYLDGTLVGSSSTALASSPGNYVYIGAGESSGGWPSHPTNTLGYFPGSIAEVAFYRSQLSQNQVLAEWLASKSSNGLTPTETITVTDPGGHALTYTYDPMQGNRLIAQTDGLGNRTTYGYDTSGFMYTTTQPNGNVITTGHDLRGNMVSQTTCENQAANQCSTQYYTYYPDDTSTNLSPDPRNDLVLTLRDGRSTSATDNRYVTTYAYNAAGNQTSATTPPVPGFSNGRTTTMTYTTSSTTAVGGGTTPAGLLATTTTPGGAVETLGYYSDGDVASVTDPAGEVTKYAYDNIGRVISKTVVSNSYPSGLTTRYTFNGGGQVLTETDPPATDHVTGATHTPQTANTYDADGNLTSVTVSDLTGGDASRTTSYTFNAHDEMASKTDALGNKTSFTYDGYGNQASQTDASGQVTDYAYDADGHMLTVTLVGYTGDPANPTSPVNLVEQSRAYDPDGRLASITDSMGRQTTYTYTDNGLVATVTRSNPATGQSFVVQSNYYDAAGNLIQRATNNGTTTTNYSVDAANRTISTTLDPTGLDRTTAYSFSPDDFVVNTTVSSGGTVYSSIDKTYDPLGRATSVTVHDDSPGHPVGWWPLTDGANAMGSSSPTSAADESGSGNTAVQSSGATWASGAASFNGTSGMLTTAAPVLNTAQSYSVSAWVNLAADSTTAGYDAVTEGGNAIGPFELQYSGGDGGWAFTSASADSSSHSYYSAHLSTKPALNVWTHLVGVFDASTGAMSLYVNGSLAATGSNPTPFNGTGPLGIGGMQTTGAQSQIFDGQVADVQLYQRALTAADVSTLYGDGRTGGALDAKLLTTSWTLDQRGLPTSMTDPNGDTSSYLYDEAGKLAQVTAPAINTEVDGGAPVLAHPITTYGYDTFGEKVSSEDPNGNVTTTNYNADGLLVSTVLPPYTPPGSSTPITATATRTYNNIGEVTSVTDGLGNTNSYTYDQLGDLATSTQPGGGVTHNTYDTNGEQLSATNPLGAQSQATYDFLGRQLTNTQIVRQPTTTADTTTSAYTDQAGYLSSVTSPTGVTTSYGYDAAGETTSVTDGAGNTAHHSYDGLGRPIVTTKPDGTSQHTTYDEAGNQIRSVSEDASGNVLQQTSAVYDAIGNPTSLVDAMGNTTTFTYNAMGMAVREVQPVSSTSSITTSFGYDAAGNPTRFTDGNGNSTIYTFNSWELPESTNVPATAADPSDRTFTTAYNADGQQTTQTSPGGVTVTNSYDTLGNLTSQTGSGADAPTTARTFGYDAVGNITSASAPGGTNTFTYDDRGMLLSASGPSGSSSFAYNAAGQMSSQSTAAGTSTFSYDNAGRAATLTDAATGATLTYSYNSDSLPTSVSYGTGAASQTFGYNSSHELTSDTLTAPGGGTEASISYGYNANGDETSKTTTGVDGASANTYTYDQADRLTSWNNGVTTVNYGYDGDGNRTQVGSQTFTYDARDELLAGAGSTYSYTPRGTLASVTTSSGSTNSTFDAFNQLITQGSQQYSYDAMGRLSASQGNAFAYLGMSSAVTSDGTFTYSRDPAGGLVGVAGQPGSAVLALTDQHRDVVGEFTATGSGLSGSTTYDPLGSVVATSGQIGNLGYQSGWTDPVTSNVKMGSRWYNPATGQFLSRDATSNSPMPNSAGANTFAYGSDNPLTAYDPNGTCGFFDFGCDAAAVAGAVGNVVSTVGSAVSPILNTVGSAVSTIANAGWNYLTAGFNTFMATAWRGLNVLATAAVHTWNTVTTQIHDGLNTVYNAVKNTAIYRAASNIVTATYHAVKYAATTAVQFVQHHAADIVSFVASTAVFMGCEAAVSALTAGAAALPGEVGCSALSGAVGNLVTYAMTTPVSKWSLGAAASTALQGAVTGAAGGLLGPLGSKLLGPVVDAVASRLGPALVDDAADAATDIADSALDDASADVGTAADSSASDATAATDASSDPASNSDPASSEPAAESEPSSSSEDQATSCSVNSFVGKTKVLLANGRRVAIDKLKAGERVRAADPATGKTGARPIVRVIRHTGMHAMVAITLLGGIVIRATDHHLLWNARTGAFAYASSLKPGDKLAEPGGRLITITRTRDYRANLTAYNLTISGIHTYYVLAGGTAVLVHNDCTGKVDYGSEGLPKATAEARRNLPAKDKIGHNGASGLFKYPDGTTEVITKFSNDTDKHAEMQLLKILNTANEGITEESGLTKLVAVYSELKPCTGTFQCWTNLNKIPGIQLSWTFDWTTSEAGKQARKDLAAAIVQYFRDHPKP
jgi:RHS repeat-associated protein